MWRAGVCSLAVFACACSSEAELDPAPEDDAAVVIEASVDAPTSTDASTRDAPPPPPPPPPVLFYELRNAPFPNSGHPDVAVHVPPRFDPWTRPGLVVFFHGFDNCVAVAVAATDAPCTPGGAVRTSFDLITQLDTAKVNAILVAVELRFDQATGDPGQLATAGRFRAMLEELFTEKLAPVLGRSLALTDLDRVVIASHSGGYRATAACLSVGQVPQIREIDLYDSLYGERTVFDAWVRTNVAKFSPAGGMRWANVYTTTGGTLSNSRDMAADARVWLTQAGLASSLLDDDTTATLPQSAFAAPVIFKRSALAHDNVPVYYFQRLVMASGFAPIP